MAITLHVNAIIALLMIILITNLFYGNCIVVKLTIKVERFKK